MSTPDPVDSLYTVHFQNTSVGEGSYYWVFGDGNSSSDFESAPIFASTGFYYVCLSLEGICDTISYCEVLILPGLNERSETYTEEFSLYPNPARDCLIISGITGAVYITLLDTMGNIMTSQASRGNTQMDIKTLPSRVYFLRISYDTNYTRRIIIAR
jgi:hypothetical protein